MMPRHSTIATAALVRLAEVTNRTWVLPTVIFFPTSRCNSRCVSCDWWKSSGVDDLTYAEIGRLAAELPALRTRVVVFSGGEPLLRPDVFEIARLFRSEGLDLHLLTSGVLLEGCAADVAREFSRVVVSLDAPTEGLYRTIRGIDALDQLERGVAALRRMAPRIPVAARATLHRLNYRDVIALIDHARAMGVDGISFLAADLSSQAFGRSHAPRSRALALTPAETSEFVEVIERAIRERRDDFISGFVAERPEKLRRLPQYYAALQGGAPFPPVACNAPWMSVVIEADGAVRPCFFHDAVGSVRQRALASIVARNLTAFRHNLDIASNPICTRCVCSIRTGWRSAPWV
jgi:MoaA/NifB/PqqE/SkfB family radical SAM enzyme